MFYLCVDVEVAFRYHKHGEYVFFFNIHSFSMFFHISFHRFYGYYFKEYLYYYLKVSGIL